MRKASSRNLLLIAARMPVPGATKTRLGVTIGMERAASLYKAFLADLADELTPHCPVALHDYVLGWGYSPPSAAFRDELRRIAGSVPSHVLTIPQIEDTDWRERQRALLSWSETQGFDRVILVASDLPHIERTTILDAFQRLDDNDVVVGPTVDGGYWLIGQRGSLDALRDVPMSTDETLTTLLANAARRELSVSQLSETFDVDREHDLDLLIDRLKRGHGRDAMHTWRAVCDLGLRTREVAGVPLPE